MSGLVIAPAVLERLAGSLLHFVWQGAAIALVAAVALRLLRRKSAEWRYATASAALLAMLAAPIVTFVFYAETGAFSLSVLRGVNGAALLATPATDVGIDTWTRRIVLAWIAGVGVCLIRLTGGWLLSRRLVRSATAVVTPVVIDAMDRARAALAFQRPVRLLATVRVEAPVVIGWLRPSILLPVSALTGLDADQLLAVLAHELAHVRRHDFLVNALQRTVESFLFYHPAVWWMSGRIRAERERCCDDLAVRVCGDRMVYARALVSLDKARAAEPVLGLSAAGVGVADRVRRILGVRGASRDWQSAAAALLFVAILVGAGTWQAPALAGPTAPPAGSPIQLQTTSTGPEPAPTTRPVPPAGALDAIVAIATAQGATATTQSGKQPPAPKGPVTQPPILPAREAAREKLGQLRVDYSADSYVKQAAEGDTIAVKTFLAAGMNIDARDQVGFTAVMKAAQMGHTETVQSLLAAGANPNLTVSSSQAPRGSALSFAAERGDTRTMSVLLAGGAEVDLEAGRDGDTALALAASNGQGNAVRLLLDNKATIEPKPDRNPAIWHAACSDLWYNAQGVPIDRGPNVNTILGVLIDRGANVNAMSTRKSTALHCAAARPSIENIKLLVDKGATVNAMDVNGISPLWSALMSGGPGAYPMSPEHKTANVMLLVDLGADVNLPRKDGWTPLIAAVSEGLTDVVRVLLAKGADPNAKPTRGATALSRAQDKPEILQLLISAGAKQ